MCHSLWVRSPLLLHDYIVYHFFLYLAYGRYLPFSMEVDQTFIAAILTIIGYSINDTVVVFDRIRETIALYPKRDRYQVINDALNSTLCPVHLIHH